MKPKISMKDLLEAGVHFGHKTSKWNPKMAPYVYTQRQGIHVLDLGLTVQKLEQACDFLVQVAKDHKAIVFVGTKRQAAPVLSKYAAECGVYYLVNRWVGGLLTNFDEVKKSLRTFEEMEESEGTPSTLDHLTTKAKYKLKSDIARKRKLFGGLKGLKELPGALFIIDPKKEESAVKEARKKQIPIVALLDTNGDPTLVDYPIPGNDDALRSIELIVSVVAGCIKEAKKSKHKSEKKKSKPKPKT